MQPEQKKHQKEYLKRLMVSHADLQFSLSALTFLTDIDANKEYNTAELRMFKCYELSFVVSYARTFSDNKGVFSKLGLKNIGIKLNPENQKLHNEIINLRNKVYAHSDIDHANMRLDGYREPLTKTFYFKSTWDEGMRYVEYLEQYQIQNLINTILHALFLKINEVAETLEDELPITLSP